MIKPECLHQKILVKAEDFASKSKILHSPKSNNCFNNITATQFNKSNSQTSLKSTKYFLVLLFCFFSASLSAQLPNDFERLKSVGNIPDDFTKLYSEKYKQDVSTINSNEKLGKKNAREFAAITNYSIDNLLLSGKVVYGDPISVYCNQLKNYLLKNDQETSDFLRIYVLKSSQVNAFSTRQGIIFVTVGLMARMKNEAQLAFVLAHEIAHYKKKHSLNAFKKNKELFSSKSKYKQLSVEEKLLKSLKHSRESELEADKFGYFLFKEAGYDVTQCLEVMDILAFSYLPLEQIDLSLKNFEDENFVFPEEFKLKEERKIIWPEEDENESSHPEIKNRKDILLDEMNEADSSNEMNVYKVSESDFLTARDIASVEMLNIDIINADFITCFYNSYLLMQKFPKNDQIVKCQAMAAYGIQKFCANAQTSIYELPDKKKEGKIGYLQYALDEMKLKDIQIFASRYIWQLSFKYPNINYLKTLRNESLVQATQYADDHSILFKDKLNISDLANGSGIKENNTRENYFRYAYLPFMKDTSFKRIFNYKFVKKEEIKPKKKRKKAEENEILVSRGDAHVKNLLMINPRYYDMDRRKTIDQQFLKSETKQIEISERVVSLAKSHDMELTILDSREDGVLNTEKFNEYSLSVDWLRERILYSGSDYSGFYSQYVKELQNKYQSNHLAINSIWSVTDKKKFNATAMVASTVFFYAVPIYLVWQLTPSHTMEYIFVVFDLNSGKLIYADGKVFSSKYRKEIISSHLYNSLNQLK
jgi:hypothetical protein